MLDALTNSDLLNVVLHVSLATAVFVLVLVLLAIAFRKTYSKIEAWQERHRLSVRIQNCTCSSGIKSPAYCCLSRGFFEPF